MFTSDQLAVHDATLNHLAQVAFAGRQIGATDGSCASGDAASYGSGIGMGKLAVITGVF